MLITDEHLATWRRQGYVVIDEFLTDEELATALDGAAQHLPMPEEVDARPPLYKSFGEAFGSGVIEFPFASKALNDLTMHPEIVRAAETLLGTEDILLDIAILWGKYAALPTDFGQPLHLDYENNSLTYPHQDPRFGKVVTIVYLTDVTEDLGPTWILSREDEPDDIWYPSIRPQEMDPRLYSNERPLTASAGSLLIYSIDVFHRGSSITADRGGRLTCHAGWRAASTPWLAWKGFAHDGNTAEMRRFLQDATPRQRELIGFPAPGHPFWNERTLAGVAARYPEMDLAPYRDAVVSSERPALDVIRDQQSSTKQGVTLSASESRSGPPGGRRSREPRRQPENRPS